jgi:pyruvate/2-oxoglutarate dehydrogenase complex dihydrolipoamide dehydrogenase (E3) component
MSQPEPFPVGAHDRALLAHVHPPAWPPASPAGRYNLVAIGGGAAGLITSLATAGLGGRAALIERHLLGGDCLNVGCVPSKALLRAAHAAHAAREASRFGVHVGAVTVDFPAVMDRLRRERAKIAEHDAAARFRDAGVDVFLGHGRFTGPDTVEVGGQQLRFARAVIATGGRPARPAIPGIDEANVFTNEEVWNLTALPARLVVVGGGPIGCELAQAFARLGSEVTIVEGLDRVLSRDDPDASRLVAAQLHRDGVRLLTSTRVLRFERAPDGSTVVCVQAGEQEHRLLADAVLLAVGRVVQTDGLGLDAAGVATDARGRITLDAHLRTTNPRIYVAGDAAGRWQFTHAADAMARLVVRNSLFFGRGRADDLLIPWATYTDPEIAHVGLTAEQAAADPRVHTITVPLHELDRAIVDGDDAGFLRVYHDPRGRLLGATAVGPHAGELIAVAAVAITAGLGLGTLAATVLPYPTLSEAWKRAGDTWNRTRLSPTLARLLAGLLAWRR